MARLQGSQKRYTDRKEVKTADIKRALTHRARLRKNYFKLLKKEGLDDDDKVKVGGDDKVKVGGDDKVNVGNDDKVNVGNDDKVKVGNNEDGTNTILKKPPASGKSKSMNFAERTAIAKQRKAKMRQEKLVQVQEKLQNIKEQEKIKQLKKQQLKQRTKYGQPVMGPRINMLLDKIKRDDNSK
ncbi:FYV7 [Candida oxycetoniae]|uniref:rRNA-processing protein FYV7 n=1 Tax=Candida oxycetoniae TaxID=497107 RepID=A0AAI9WX35_9ASCO|nr:FYV7 [Candida oxycetoniae]KAI3403340.1 FYV7 [Candida oxycetoniae]